MNYQESLRLKRIVELIDSFKNQSFAGTIGGITRETIRNYINGRTEPKLSVIGKMCEYKHVSLDYIWFGDETNAYYAMHEYPAKYTAREFVFIDRLLTEAEAGNGSTVDDQEESIKVGYRREFIEKNGWVATDLRQFIVKNDSMEPTILPGDAILVDISITKIIKDAIYVILDGDLLRVKRLQKMIGGKVRISSDNDQLYTYQEVNESEFGEGGSVKIRGLVRWREGGNKL